MKTGGFPKRAEKPLLSPWLIILFTAPVPLLLFVFFFSKWYSEKTDFSRIKTQFIQRQNSVLAFDAVEVATGFSDLLEKAGRDVQVLPLVTVSGESLHRFYLSQTGSFTRYDNKNHAVLDEPLPFYNRVAILNLQGDTLHEVYQGKILGKRKLADCHQAELCDQQLYQAATKLKPGEMRYGRLLKYYSPQGKPNSDQGASLAVAYRGPNSIYILGIDYLHLRDHLTTPVFPYDSKRDLMQAYDKGNYIFIVDEGDNIVTHPHYWKEAGIELATGDWMPPMLVDDENGKKPINIREYQAGKLKEYFQRLLKTSFTANSVDIFRAPNLAGTNRVLSVAPIFLSKGQFVETGVYGHVVIACNVEYFEEPKERIVPYY